MKCPNCNGLGLEPLENHKLCDMCKGSGFVSSLKIEEEIKPEIEPIEESVTAVKILPNTFDEIYLQGFQDCFEELKLMKIISEDLLWKDYVNLRKMITKRKSF
jgi:hypothetical protein